MNMVERAFASGERLNVLGVRIDPVTRTEAVDRIIAWAGRPSGPSRIGCATGVHGVMEARRDASFHRVLEKVDLNLPDGMPLVWIGRAAGFRSMERVSGPDLMLRLCAAGRRHGLRHFFCGGREGVADALPEALRRQFPGLDVGGTLCPPGHPLTHEDYQAIAGSWKKSGSNILWLGVSTPKQETWARVLAPMLNQGVILTVGAAFDYNSGRIRRAPLWMQRSGVEWLYRLLREPRRLAGRYLRNNPAFCALAALQLCGILLPASGRGRST